MGVVKLREEEEKREEWMGRLREEERRRESERVFGGSGKRASCWACCSVQQCSNYYHSVQALGPAKESL